MFQLKMCDYECSEKILSSFFDCRFSSSEPRTPLPAAVRTSGRWKTSRNVGSQDHNKIEQPPTYFNQE